jgi:signal transduction histidine kinase
VPAQEVLETVAERFARRAREQDRAIEVDSAPTGMELDADPDRLEQALGNLVENALSHADGTVRLSAEARDGLVELHVRDEGAGFPEQFLEHAFNRFAQADSARRASGAGLGLPIVEAIATAHGGTAHATNRDGRGADVWLSIPRA